MRLPITYFADLAVRTDPPRDKSRRPERRRCAWCGSRLIRRASKWACRRCRCDGTEVRTK